MLEASIKALVEGRPEPATEAFHMEKEADRIYWLIVRQLLLAIRDRTVSWRSPQGRASTSQQSRPDEAVNYVLSGRELFVSSLIQR